MSEAVEVKDCGVKYPIKIILTGAGVVECILINEI